MYTKHTLATLLGAVATATAYQGFNYGSTFTNGAAKSQQDFEAEFRAAARLPGTDGAFTSARLYTMVQAGTANDPISAIQAAINTRTSLLLGLWASAGEDMFNNELRALERAIEQYGDELTGLIAGISVGSEDLYRNSPTGIAANSNPGANPQTIVDYVGRVRQTISGTPFANFPIGHVDTWTAFDNSSNSAVVDAVDWLGFNGFAYFEDTQDNDVSNGKALFDRAMDRTRAAARGKPIWVTETGWPVSGRTFGNGVPSPENAERFWQDVGCPLFGETNVWWYILRYAPTSPNPDFGIIGSDVNSAPRFDLSCPAVVPTTSSAAPTTSTTTRATSSATTVVPPATTETENDDDSSEPTPTPTPSSTHVDVESKTSYQPVPTTTHDSGDDNDDDTPIVPGPPPTTLSSSVSSALPTESSESSSGNESSAAPQPTGAVEPGSASAMSFSAAFLAMMLAVAMF